MRHALLLTLLSACSLVFPDSDFLGGDAGDLAPDADALNDAPEVDAAVDGGTEDVSTDAPRTRCTRDEECSGSDVCNSEGTCEACDLDGDGFGREECAEGPVDCDDGNPAIFPGAPAVCGDGFVNACEGTGLVVPEGFPYEEASLRPLQVVDEIRDGMAYDLSVNHVAGDSSKVTLTYTRFSGGSSAGRLLVFDDALGSVLERTLTVAPGALDVHHSRSVRRAGDTPFVDVALHSSTGLLGRASFNGETDEVEFASLNLSVEDARCFAPLPINVQAPQRAPADRIDIMGDGTILFYNRFADTLARIPRGFEAFDGLECRRYDSAPPSLASHGGELAVLIDESQVDGPDLTVWSPAGPQSVPVTQRLGSVYAPALATLSTEFNSGLDYETIAVVNTVPTVGGTFGGDFGINSAAVRCNVDLRDCALVGEQSLDLSGGELSAVGAPSGSPLFEGRVALMYFERRQGAGSTSTDRIVLRLVGPNAEISEQSLTLGELEYVRGGPLDMRAGETSLSVDLEGGVGATVYFGVLARDPEVETRNQAETGNANVLVGSATLCESL